MTSIFYMSRIKRLKKLKKNDFQDDGRGILTDRRIGSYNAASDPE